MVTSPHALASEAGLKCCARAATQSKPPSPSAPRWPLPIRISPAWAATRSGSSATARATCARYRASARRRRRCRLCASDSTRGAAAAITTAATVDTWDRAFAISRDLWGGTQAWSSLFQRAIGHAHDGFDVTPSQRFWQAFRQDELRDWHGFAATFMPHDRLPEPGDRLHQPALARSLDRIATHGAREFYEGELAERIVAGLRDAGSPLTLQDLRHTAARDEAPLRVAYRGGELLSLPPPTQGVTTLQIMGMLERFDFTDIAEGSALLSPAGGGRETGLHRTQPLRGRS
jgi:gamma-glutamyltranspeptidase/glutathione hydrolase